MLTYGPPRNAEGIILRGSIKGCQQTPIGATTSLGSGAGKAKRRPELIPLTGVLSKKTYSMQDTQPSTSVPSKAIWRNRM